MLIPIVALVACEADLALAAGAIGLGLRHKGNLPTLFVSGLVALGFALAVFVIWALWFVAPGCLAAGASIGCINQHAAGGLVYLGPGALAQWLWMLGVALAARRLSGKRRLAPISG